MKTWFILPVLALLACNKTETEPPVIPERVDAPLDQLVDGYECSPGTRSDTYAMLGHDEFPQMVASGTDVWVHVSGTPTPGANGSVQWSVGCFTLKVNGAVVGTFQSAEPHEFHYHVP